jgi:hypothetical protein
MRSLSVLLIAAHMLEKVDGRLIWVTLIVTCYFGPPLWSYYYCLSNHFFVCHLPSPVRSSPLRACYLSAPVTFSRLSPLCVCHLPRLSLRARYLSAPVTFLGYHLFACHLSAPVIFLAYHPLRLSPLCVYPGLSPLCACHHAALRSRREL